MSSSCAILDWQLAGLKPSQIVECGHIDLIWLLSDSELALLQSVPNCMFSEVVGLVECVGILNDLAIAG